VTPRPREAALEPPHSGLLYLPLWILVAIGLFFAARYLTKLLLGTLGA
jgi:hypothetical protein